MAIAHRRVRHFTSANSAALERSGVRGIDVVVRLEGSTLFLKGEESGELAIPAASVDRIRQFRAGVDHSAPIALPPLYETKIWWGGRTKPVLLIPIENPRVYRDVIGDFARHVAAVHGLARLRIGPGYMTAIINLLLVGIPCLFLFAFMLWISLTDGGWWWVATAAVFMLFFWLAGRNLVSRWPRHVDSLDRFLAELD